MKSTRLLAISKSEPDPKRILSGGLSLTEPDTAGQIVFPMPWPEFRSGRGTGRGLSSRGLAHARQRGRLFHIPAPAVWRLHDQWLVSLDSTRVMPGIDAHDFPYEVQSTPLQADSRASKTPIRWRSFKQSAKGSDCQFEDHACGVGPADIMTRVGALDKPRSFSIWADSGPEFNDPRHGR